MAVSYRARVGDVLEVLAEGLAPFVDRQMRREFPDEDWIVGAATKLGKREPVLASPTDPQFQLEVMIRWWGPVFAQTLSKDTRDTVQGLRKARNDWAHIDDTHPIDFEYALRVHNQAEDLLQQISSPVAEHISRLTDTLQRETAQDQAEEQGVSASDVLLVQLGELRADREHLTVQLDEARDAAESAVGRQRAVARQLAELQSQYAAVSGLRERYQDLQGELEELRGGSPTPNGQEQSGPLADTSAAIASLQAESARLESELRTARAQLESFDPVATPAGRRWLLLVAALVIVLGIAVLLAFALGTTR